MKDDHKYQAWEFNLWGDDWCQPELFPGRQTKFMSLVEAATNVVAGLVLSILAQIIVFPMVGIDVGLGVNLLLTAIFTALSVVRSYAVRRFFEWLR